MDFSDSIKKYGRRWHFLQGGISDGDCPWNWIWGGLQGERCPFPFRIPQLIGSVTNIAAFQYKDMTPASFSQAKEWRMEWLKRRRERLAVKLQETQREIELMKTN